MSDVTSGVALGALTAATLSILGVEPQSLVYAAMGAGIGTTWAPEMPRIRAAVVFTCVICLSALAGTVAAVLWTSGSGLFRNLFAGVIAVVFHPLISSGIAKMPEAWDGLLRLVRLKQ